MIIHDVIYQHQTSAVTIARHARNLGKTAPVAWNSLNRTCYCKLVHWLSFVIASKTLSLSFSLHVSKWHPVRRGKFVYARTKNDHFVKKRCNIQFSFSCFLFPNASCSTSLSIYDFSLYLHVRIRFHCLSILKINKSFCYIIQCIESFIIDIFANDIKISQYI